MIVFAMIVEVIGLIVTLVTLIAHTSFWLILVSLLPYVVIISLLSEVIHTKERLKRLEKALMQKHVISQFDMDSPDPEPRSED